MCWSHRPPTPDNETDSDRTAASCCSPGRKSERKGVTEVQESLTELVHISQRENKTTKIRYFSTPAPPDILLLNPCGRRHLRRSQHFSHKLCTRSFFHPVWPSGLSLPLSGIRKAVPRCHREHDSDHMWPGKCYSCSVWLCLTANFGFSGSLSNPESASDWVYSPSAAENKK